MNILKKKGKQRRAEGRGSLWGRAKEFDRYAAVFLGAIR